jgi:stress-induced morphogen
VIDESGGCGAKFSVIIVSESFKGVSLIARHRLVNECLQDVMPLIHALSLKTWTPEQYSAKVASGEAPVLERITLCV